VEIKHCKRCGCDWCFRGTGRPLRCGKCKTPYWDVEVGDGRVGERGAKRNVSRGRKGTGAGVAADERDGIQVAVSLPVRGVERSRVVQSLPSHAAGCKCLMCKGRV